jgi:hypothetical protein
MPHIDENRIKGNYGVYALMKELSKFCFPRPIFEGTDVGIDLYCETYEKPVIGGRPFLHFWAQVKTTKDNILSDGTMPFSFETHHIKYWSRQPVPVFAFIVRVPNWPLPDNIYPFYVIDIKNHVFQNQELLRGGSHTLHSNFTINSQDDLKYFIFNTVPYISAIHKIPEGIVQSLPTIDPEYEIIPVVDLCYQYLDQILWHIRRTSTSAIYGSYNHAFGNEEIKKNIRKLKEIVNIFEDDTHWETHYSLGLASFLDENFAEAKDFFNMAIETIEKDPRTRGKDNWTRTKEHLRSKIAECDEKIAQLNI